MVPTDKPDEFTEMKYEKIKFNVKLKDKLFTLRNLQR
jgi:hypothetical protein